jgi:hypothetical protein
LIPIAERKTKVNVTPMPRPICTFFESPWDPDPASVEGVGDPDRKIVEVVGDVKGIEADADAVKERS